jgi:hypothetical protein
MPTTTQRGVHRTRFDVGTTTVRFGVLWPDPAAVLMTDWVRESRVVEQAGAAGFTETQLLGLGPYKVSYNLFFDSVADYRALDALVQATGTLVVVQGSHTVPNPDGAFFDPTNQGAYDTLAGVTLTGLTSTGVAPDGSCEATATFVRSA